MAGFLQGITPAVERLVAVQLQEHEYPVLAVGTRIAQRLFRHRYETASLLAGAFGDELFQPEAQTCDARRGENRDLVALLVERGLRECDAEGDGRMLHRLDTGGAGRHHELRPLDQTRDIVTCERRGQKSEVRQRRVAAADVGRIEKYPAYAAGFSELGQRRARIGDVHELSRGTRGIAVRGGFCLGEGILAKGPALERGARLAGLDEQRRPDIDLLLDRGDRLRYGAVEHQQLRETAALAEGAPQDERT